MKYMLKLNCKNNYSFFHLLLLSGDIEVNPGPVQATQNNEKGMPDLQNNYGDDKFKMFNKRGLHFFHVNINSILPKIEELRHIARLTKISVIGISESKIDSSVNDEEISIPGFEIIRKDRNRHGGGVLAYVSNDLSYNLREDLFSNNEMIFIDIYLPHSRPILIGIAYRPPTDSNFVKTFHETILKCDGFINREVYIMGDININMENVNPCSSIKTEYIDFCLNIGISQIIKSFTHVTNNSSSLIDHILTNSQDRISQSGVIETTFSDHFSIFFTRKISRNKYNKHRTIKIRSFKNYDKNVYREKLKDIKLPKLNEHSNLDEIYEKFVDKLSETIDDVAPLREIRTKNSTPDWFDGEIMDEIMNRDKLYRIFKSSKLEGDGLRYRSSRNKVQALINSKKQSFITNSLNENKRDSKKLWKTLKNLGLPSKSKSDSKINLNINGNINSKPEDIANHFNDFYSTLAEKLVEKLPDPPNKFTDNETANYYRDHNIQENNFTFQPADPKEIAKILENINSSKSPGFDNIPGRFLKDGSEVISKLICDIFNLSILLSKFPKQCKTAKIRPIYKKGSKLEAVNYRPISLLPLISKVFERCIHDQLQKYVTNFNIIYKFQSGFRSDFSTDTCLSYLHDKILKGLDKGEYTGMILIDLQKAFDTIDHKILIYKLKYIGLAKTSIDWIQSYLTSRVSFVEIESHKSSLKDIACGVPQGSILGPLLFLLYVNDMSQAVTCDLLLYADDSCLTVTHKDVKYIEETLNNNLSSLCDWLVDNKLSIHLGKTESILFGTRNSLNKTNLVNIKYESQNIEQKQKVKYLGIILDDNLTGKSMVDSILTKINAKLRFLYRKRKFLDNDTRRLLCNSLIQPHYDFACSSWYPLLNKNLKQRLQVSQNKCIRFCLNLNYRDRIDINRFREINWLPVSKRVEQCICTLIYKFFHKNVPKYIEDIFNVKTTKYNIRNPNMLTRPLCKNASGQKAISFLGPKIWADIPNDIKKKCTITSFKHEFKKHFLEGQIS